jgi:hypothetical protein
MATPPARSMPYRGRLCPFNYARMYSCSPKGKNSTTPTMPTPPFCAHDPLGGTIVLLSQFYNQLWFVGA